MTPSIVTCCSAIASSSADCVFGIARLISSTRTTFANTGPGRNSKSRSRWSKTERPVTSVGCRSGVHWMRAFVAPSTLPAIARASTVFAVPGTSSRRTWPPETRAVRTSLISSVLPRTTVSMFASSRAAVSVAGGAPPFSSPCWSRAPSGRRTLVAKTCARVLVSPPDRPTRRRARPARVGDRRERELLPPVVRTAMTPSCSDAFVFSNCCSR